MLTQDPVKIPEIPGKISFKKKDETEYIQYLTERKYNADRKYTEPQRIVIGRRSESMPGMMYPNDNYEKYILEKEERTMEESMTPEEEAFARNNKIYGMYYPFFDALYHEFRQQTRKKPEERLNLYKAENLNRVLTPLKEMMKNEEYAELLGLIDIAKDGKAEMSYSDVMILLTQYKSALTKYHRSHR